MIRQVYATARQARARCRLRIRRHAHFHGRAGAAVTGIEIDAEAHAWASNGSANFASKFPISRATFANRASKRIGPIRCRRLPGCARAVLDPSAVIRSLCTIDEARRRYLHPNPNKYGLDQLMSDHHYALQASLRFLARKPSNIGNSPRRSAEHYGVGYERGEKFIFLRSTQWRHLNPVDRFSHVDHVVWYRPPSPHVHAPESPIYPACAPNSKTHSPPHDESRAAYAHASEQIISFGSSPSSCPKRAMPSFALCIGLWRLRH